MKTVKVSVDIQLKKIPRNCIYVDVDDSVQDPCSYAEWLIREQLTTGKIAIKDENNIIPDILIDHFDIITKNC